MRGVSIFFSPICTTLPGGSPLFFERLVPAISEFLAPFDGPAQGDIVGIFQFSTKG